MPVLLAVDKDTAATGFGRRKSSATLGVTYKTAWRMCNLIRQYMGYVDGDAPLGGDGGIVEVDKMFYGGKDKKGENDKTVVFGAIERGGDVITKVLPGRGRKHVMPAIFKWIKAGSRVAIPSSASVALCPG